MYTIDMISQLSYKDLDSIDGVSALKRLCSSQKDKFTVSVEGNIGCGKSTLLNYFSKHPKVEALKEPVEQWTNLKGHNALELLYEDPARWNFSFNNYAFLTRTEMHTYEQKVPVKMLERSLYSTKYVFVENSYRNGLLTAVESTVLSQWFDFLTSSSKVSVDLFIYLRAPPEICIERIKKRNRMEEANVSLDFIRELHCLHEDWLIRKKADVPAPVLVLDASCDLPNMRHLYQQHISQILCGVA